jgi:hypothetical protein
LHGKEVLLVTGNIDGFYLFAGGGIGGLLPSEEKVLHYILGKLLEVGQD